jgi:hypothetical protein
MFIEYHMLSLVIALTALFFFLAGVRLMTSTGRLILCNPDTRMFVNLRGVVMDDGESGGGFFYGGLLLEKRLINRFHL